MTLEAIPTLIDLLAYRADVSASKVAFTFEGDACTYGELWHGINRFAAELKRFGIQRQKSVLLALPNSVEFFFAFYGIQRAGGIAVPIFPGSGAERIFAIAALCDAKIIVVPSNTPAEILHQVRETGKGRCLSVITVEAGDGDVEKCDFPGIQPEDIAFIQYTSGSTGNPKGVMLTHANLLTNIRQLIAGMEITESDIFVSWLPVYHDMGLILKTMVPFYLAAQTHLLPTALRDVRVWLRAIQLRKATFTAAPDFAYRLTLSRVESNEYDLSSLRVALNAAEPVRAGTILEFEKRFGLPHVMTAGYGLAEATVGVSMSRPGRSPKVDERGIVSVGRPFPGVEVKIVDKGRTLGAGEVGEIFIKSIANCKGYYKNLKETRKLFRNGFIKSGDLGYLDKDGYLFIVGRKKNMIKHAGQTIAPQEIEETVDAIPAIRFSAAVGIDRGRIEGEQAYVFAEVRNRYMTRDSSYELTLQIVQAIHQRLGFHPGRVLLVKPHTIPRTYNGKIQHTRLWKLYSDGSLKNQERILSPGN